MMKKVILKQDPEAGNPLQRNNLFKTSCKMKDKVCKVIIDNGSTEKLVSMGMVEKIELEATTHLTLYKVSWLQKGHQVTLTQQCLVNFKIGGYRDEILCDVIPMDFYNGFLGRP